MYYRVPHRFRVVRRLDRAILQYMLFSPPTLSLETSLWLPKEPLSLLEINRLTNREAVNSAFEGAQKGADIPRFSYCLFDGEKAVLSALDINRNVSDIVNDPKLAAIQDGYIRSKSQVEALELCMIHDINRNMEMQAAGDPFHEETLEKEEIVQKMQAAGKVQ